MSRIQVQIEEDEGFIEPQREKQLIPAPIARPGKYIRLQLTFTNIKVVIIISVAGCYINSNHIKPIL